MAKELKVGNKCMYNYYEDIAGSKNRHTQECVIVKVHSDEVAFKYIVQWEDGLQEPVKKESLIKIKKQKTTETMETKEQSGTICQERKFKVGDVCKYSSSGDSNGSSAFDGEFCTIKQVRHEAGYDFPYVISFRNVDLSQDYPVKEEALELIESSVTINVSDLKKIHDVACRAWKQKIAEMVKPFEDTVILTKQQVDEMFLAASGSQTEVLEEIFGKQKKEDSFFDFGGSYTINTDINENPIYVRRGLANPGFMGKEIGLNGRFIPILVVNGVETELEGGNGTYIKFKIR